MASYKLYVLYQNDCPLDQNHWHIIADFLMQPLDNCRYNGSFKNDIEKLCEICDARILKGEDNPCTNCAPHVMKWFSENPNFKDWPVHSKCNWTSGYTPGYNPSYYGEFIQQHIIPRWSLRLIPVNIAKTSERLIKQQTYKSLPTSLETEIPKEIKLNNNANTGIIEKKRIIRNPIQIQTESPVRKSPIQNSIQDLTKKLTLTTINRYQFANNDDDDDDNNSDYETSDKEEGEEEVEKLNNEPENAKDEVVGSLGQDDSQFLNLSMMPKISVDNTHMSSFSDYGTVDRSITGNITISDDEFKKIMKVDTGDESTDVNGVALSNALWLALCKGVYMGDTYILCDTEVKKEDGNNIENHNNNNNNYEFDVKKMKLKRATKLLLVDMCAFIIKMLSERIVERGFQSFTDKTPFNIHYLLRRHLVWEVLHPKYVSKLFSNHWARWTCQYLGFNVRHILVKTLIISYTINGEEKVKASLKSLQFALSASVDKTLLVVHTVKDPLPILADPIECNSKTGKTRINKSIEMRLTQRLCSPSLPPLPPLPPPPPLSLSLSSALSKKQLLQKQSYQLPTSSFSSSNIKINNTETNQLQSSTVQTHTQNGRKDRTVHVRKHKGDRTGAFLRKKQDFITSYSTNHSTNSTTHSIT